MPAAEIKALRQAGRLDEALAMALEELNANPDNIWGKRNISWVYYEYLKKYIQEENFDGFIENLIKIKDLNLPEAEVMIFDTSAYQVGSMLFKIHNSEPIDYSQINKIFDIIRDFHFTKPSESYSFLMKAFQKGSQNWSRFIEFADWWGLENFADADFQQEEYNDRQMPALADKVYGTYCKKLIEGEAVDAFGAVKEVDKEKIKLFLPQLDGVIDKHPEYRYLPYYKAQMLMELGDRDNVLEAFLPFAKQKQNDFWVWGLMAEIFNEDNELEFACYCKALSLRTPNDFLIKIRQVFAKLLIERQLYAEAKVEIKYIIAVRQAKRWRIPNDIIQWTESSWYSEANELHNNKDLYGKHRRKAEELLYSDLPEHLIAIEFVNHDKKILSFVKDKTMQGFFNYDGLMNNPKIGDILKVRIEAVGNEGFHRAFTLEKIEDSANVDLPALKIISGTIRLPENKSFGFIDDIFIPPNLVESSGLTDGQTISVKAILSYNKSKKEWGWKGIEAIN
jgi:tetratricopeptide (TPR) repeat protein